MEGPGLHIVILDDGIRLVKRAGGDWREMQAAFPGFVTSAGPFSLAEAIEWIELEWPDIHAARAAEIALFAAGPADILRLV